MPSEVGGVALAVEATACIGLVATRLRSIADEPWAKLTRCPAL